ncbi:MAG: hypothetical protein OJF50_006620 [Nitrospira sp.]|jgi:hypothetical protein|nr:hypothetical protein [Nitrospira sp.]
MLTKRGPRRQSEWLDSVSIMKLLLVHSSAASWVAAAMCQEGELGLVYELYRSARDPQNIGVSVTLERADTTDVVRRNSVTCP